MRLRRGVHIEFLDRGALVLVPEDGTVYEFDAHGAAVLRMLVEGASLDEIPTVLAGPLAELVDLGAVEVPAGWSRRHVLRVGAVTAGSALVASFVLPSVVAAASHVGPDPDPNGPPGSFTAPGVVKDVKVPAGVEMTFVLVGGGGGGGVWNGGNGGPGLVLEGLIPARENGYSIDVYVAGGGQASVSSDRYRGGAGGVGYHVGGAGGGDGTATSGNGGGGGGGASAIVGPGILVVAPGGGGGGGGPWSTSTQGGGGSGGGAPGTAMPPAAGAHGYNGFGSGGMSGYGGRTGSPTGGGAGGLERGGAEAGEAGMDDGGAGGNGSANTAGSGGGGGAGRFSGGGGGGGVSAAPTHGGGGGGGPGSSYALGVTITSRSLADMSGPRDIPVGTGSGHRGQGDCGARDLESQGPGGNGSVTLNW